MSKKNITFLGTGAADALKYYQASFYIKENQTSLLVDSGGGAGILTQLDKRKIKLKDIKYISITHKHIDHILGLFWILRFLGSEISRGQADKLTILCSHKVEKIIRDIAKKLLKETIIALFDKKIFFKNIKDQMIIRINSWQLEIIDIRSKKIEQLGFSLKFKDGIKLVHLSDEPYKKELHSKCNNVDYLIHEAFCLEKDRKIFKPEKINHSTVKEAAEYAAEINAKNLILYHSEDKTFDKRKKLYTDEAKKYFSGKVFVPDDLDVIKL